MVAKQIPTLYEWAGGIGPITALFRAFYARVPSDPILAPVFAEMPVEHFETVAHLSPRFWAGPACTVAMAVMVIRPWWRNISTAI